jgi:hypothetical protein
VLDDTGQVNAIVEIGNTIVAAGKFTQVKRPGGPTLLRSNIFAFDKTTNDILPFSPNVDGEILTMVTDGSAIYIGGKFLTIDGVTKRRIAKLDLAGNLLEFKAKVSSGTGVYDMAIANGRLYFGGAISAVNGEVRQRFAAAALPDGALDPNIVVGFDGKHNGGTKRVHKLDITPDGNTLIAIGNFLTVDDQDRRQIAILDISNGFASVTSWRTSRYEGQCHSRFDTYMRDVDVDPDGRYFIVGTTGAFFGGANAGVMCDTVSRWELGTSGSGQQPTWVDYSGGDTTFSVAATGVAVYVGGHQRWWNNPFSGDRAGPGAVSRPGIAVLDPLNGLPFSWNPERHPRGRGVFALVGTRDGLWLGSDTNKIADLYRAKIAFMPLDGGWNVPVHQTPSLPVDMTLIGSSSTLTRRSGFNPPNLGTPSNVATSVNWSSARGAFTTNGMLYTGWSNGTFVGRPLSNLSNSHTVDLHGLTNSYFPVASLSGMFFTDGKLFYTVNGDGRLFYRYFTPESEVIGAQTFVAQGSGWADVAGMELTNGTLWIGHDNGSLTRMNFNGMPTGSQTTVAGAGSGWDTNGMFVWP